LKEAESANAEMKKLQQEFVREYVDLIVKADNQ